MFSIAPYFFGKNHVIPVATATILYQVVFSESHFALQQCPEAKCSLAFLSKTTLVSVRAMFINHQCVIILIYTNSGKQPARCY